MNSQIAFKEMVECIEEFGECVITLINGEQYDICPATHFIGGEEGYYMSSELGSIMYSDVENICNDLLDLIERKDIAIEEITVD